MSKKRFCLQCDDGTALKHWRRDMEVVYRERKTVIRAVSGWHCPACGECEFDAGEGRRYSAAVDAFAATVDQEIAREIKAIRKMLGLRQSDAGNLFGGGASAFSEYERGKTQPHKSTLLLMKLLHNHPELLNEIRPD